VVIGLQVDIGLKETAALWLFDQGTPTESEVNTLDLILSSDSTRGMRV